MRFIICLILSSLIATLLVGCAGFGTDSDEKSYESRPAVNSARPMFPPEQKAYFEAYHTARRETLRESLQNFPIGP